MKKTRLSLISISVVFLSILAMITSLSACGNSSSSSSSNSQNSTDFGGDNTINFMLDWTANTNHIGIYMAQQLGYYKDAGLSVTILPTSQAGAETAVESNVANIGFTSLSNVAAFNAKGSHLHFVFDLTQKPVARWCALKSRTDITSPKDFSGKTFVSFGSAEQTAVVKRMIANAGGNPDFQTATVGTSTFETLSSGKGDFAGFYDTWEGVESRLKGPELNCFNAADYGVPGNPDQLGFAVNSTWEQTHSKQLQAFIAATAHGYAQALADPDKSAEMLVSAAPEAALDPTITAASLHTIMQDNDWGDTTEIAKSASHMSTSDVATTVAATSAAGLGSTDISQAQKYLDFLWNSDVYDTDGKHLDQAPQASQLATNSYVTAH